MTFIKAYQAKAEKQNKSRFSKIFSSFFRLSGMRPVSIPTYIAASINLPTNLDKQINMVKVNYQKLRKTGMPAVTVIIPAFNEETSILNTLYSLASNITTKAVEIIVVNNNSTDNTESLVKLTGISCITETKQGITAARNAGLSVATGTYILNADADAIYPPAWIDKMIDPLQQDNKRALTYGRFSFIPTTSTGRISYFFYEHAADLLRLYNKYFKEEAVNVYGFNSAYRRIEGLQVEGYNHPKGANEDGYLALKLRNSFSARLFYVTDTKALVWTSDRRIQIEGGFIKGIIKRVNKLLFPKQFVQQRTDL